MLTLRNSMPSSELDFLSSEITARLLKVPAITNARTISTYLHTGSEVRTKEIVNWALANAKRVTVPITDRAHKRLVFSELRDPESELERGNYGIQEAKAEFRRPVPLEEADVVLIPGVAWDRRGYRIGYGAGYYDRSINSLQKHIAKIGLAYEFQIVPSIPTTSYDRRVDAIVTERQIVKTSAR
jgi:5-formyltetrahydrofolate cyclo-ligase